MSDSPQSPKSQAWRIVIFDPPAGSEAFRAKWRFVQPFVGRPVYETFVSDPVSARAIIAEAQAAEIHGHRTPVAKSVATKANRKPGTFYDCPDDRKTRRFVRRQNGGPIFRVVDGPRDTRGGRIAAYRDLEWQREREAFTASAPQSQPSALPEPINPPPLKRQPTSTADAVIKYGSPSFTRRRT